MVTKAYPMKTGGSRNPGGRPKYSGEWGDAIRKVLHELVEVSTGERRKRLEVCARSLVAAASAGDISALREIGDRIDGKAIQPVEAAISVTGDVAALLERRRARAGLSEPEPDEADRS
jgi:Family of unknown function (DUF5681)